MADELKFRVRFDLEEAVQKATGDVDSVLRRLQTAINSKPLAINLKTDGASDGSIDSINARMRELTEQWNKLTEAQRITHKTSGEFTPEAKKILAEYTRLTGAAETYAKTLKATWADNKRAVKEQEAAAKRQAAAQEAAAKLARDIDIQRYNEANRRKLKEQADDDKRYQKWVELKEKEYQKEVEVAQKKANAQERASRATTKKVARADRNDEATYYTNRALKAQEDIIDNLNKKLSIYQQRISGQQVGSDAWNKTALEIRRVTEELQKANQQMQDFQQKSFAGLSDSLVTGRVQALTQYREQLRQLDAQFNHLNQTGRAYNTNGSLSTDANDILKQRQQVTKQINKMLTTAADAQIQREKEVNRIIEQRKAKQDAIIAKQKTEQAVIQAKINKLKEERRVLTQQESSIDAITAKLRIQQRRLNAADINSTQFSKIAAEVKRLTQRLEELKKKTDEATGKAYKGKTSADEVSGAFRNQATAIQRAATRLAAYFTIHSVFNFLSQLREVTAQFELQRVSLGAILQNQARADILFSELKSLALSSPVKLLDLTKYTKQLAAYKIGYEELFDTTKRLTDISVGLGVSMDRIVLLYGQVRATGYLRASEVRQATEAGIPLVEELAKKLSAANGELVTSAQVMDMISERQISFEQVKEVFEDMTDKGGIFYNMQEKQGNTLYGMWAKLGDAWSIMLDKMGSSGAVNGLMKGLIDLATQALKHWKSVSTVILTVAAAYGVQKLATMTATLATNQYSAAGKKLIRQKELLVVMTKKEVEATKNAGWVTRLSARMHLAHAQASKSAAAATNIFSKAVKGLWASFLANPLGWIITLVGILYAALGNLDDKFKELSADIAEIESKYRIKTVNDQRDFKRLADTAVGAADGSRVQREALDELQRKYGEMVGVENLQIERLSAMKDKYAALSGEIEIYNTKMKYDEKESKIKDSYGENVKESQKALQDALQGSIWTIIASFGAVGTYDKNVVQNVVYRYRELIEEAIEKQQPVDASKFFKTAILESGLSESDWVEFINNGGIEFNDFANALIAEGNALEQNNAERDKAVASISKYQEGVDNLAKALQKIRKEESGVQDATIGNYKTLVVSTLKGFDLTNVQDAMNAQIAQISVYIQAMLNESGVGFDKSMNYLYSTVKNGASEISEIDFPSIYKKITESAINEQDKTRLLHSIEQIQKLYTAFAPTNLTERKLVGRLNYFSNKFGVEAQKAMMWAMKAGESLTDYRKRLEDEEKSIVDSISRLEIGIKLARMFGGETKESEKKIKELKDQMKVIKEMLNIVGRTPSKNKGRGAKQDPRLQILNEMVSSLKSINKEYEDLVKKEGVTRALKDTNQIYEDTFKNMQAMNAKYKFGLPEFDVPKNVNELTAYLGKIREAMKKLPKSDKNVLSLQVDIDKLDIDAKQKQIEREIKELTDKIAKGKTAKEFYDKILDLTGDIELAANVSVRIYGSSGEDLKEQVREQIAKAFSSIEYDHADIMPEIDEIINRGAYEELRDYIKLLPESQQKAAEDLIKNQQQMSVKQYEQWLKDLQKAKDYADKRIELSRYTANQIAEIEERIATLNPSSADYESQKKMLEKLIQGYKDSEDKEAAKIEYDMFKDMPLYVQMFDNLDNASTTMLNNMKRLLEQNKGKWGEFLDPTQLKEMQGRMNEIDKQLAARNPFKSLSKSLKDWWNLRKSGHTRKGDEQAAAEAIEAESKAYDKWVESDKAYQDALKKHNNDTNNTEVQDAKAVADAAEQEYKAAQKASEDAQNQAKTWQDIADNIDNANAAIDKYQEAINKALEEILSMMEVFGVDAIDMEFFNSIKEGFNQILDGGQAAASAFAKFTTGDYFSGAMNSVSALTSIASGISNLFTAGKVRKANKEIKKQEELLEELEYAYSRLGNAVDKAFGKDYINNYQKQIENLQAQQKAYQKQADAERSKGKKADEEKIKEYENSVRDTADEIADMINDLNKHFLGSGLEDSAKKIAESWITARASMSDTFDAIESDYKEMVKNMIVEGMAARIVQNALSPLFEEVDAALKDNDTERATQILADRMESTMQAANDGLEVMWKSLEAKGYDLKELLGDSDESEYTGIAKNVSSASSEEINANTAALNVQNFYMSHIDENVAIIARMMQSGESASEGGWSDYQRQAMDAYLAIEKNTADTVVECRRAAIACEEATKRLDRAMKTKGATSGFNVFLNN